MSPDPTPPEAPIPWYQSRSFKALVQTSVLLTLGWLLVGLNTNVWDWKSGLLVPIVSNALVGLRELWSPTVAGPFDFMNKKNLPAQVPAK